MNKRIKDAVRAFNLKRVNGKAMAWGLASLVFMVGVIGLNFLNVNPWVSFGLLVTLFAIAVFVYTFVHDMKVRKALADLDFILDELKDPVAMIEIIDKVTKLKKATPAYLHMRLRAMLYVSSHQEIQSFLNDYGDVLGESPNVLSAAFRIKSFGERVRDVDAYERRVNEILEKAYKKARSNAVREDIMHQRVWFDIQVSHTRGQYQAVLKHVERVKAKSISPLEALRASYYEGLAYGQLGKVAQARQCLNRVISEGNTTRFVDDATQALQQWG